MVRIAAAIKANEDASHRVVEVRTRKSRHKYSARVTDGNGRLIGDYSFTLTDQGMVWVYTPGYSIGLYRLERFGGELSPGSIRRFFAEKG